jgi:hypothetical protein
MKTGRGIWFPGGVIFLAGGILGSIGAAEAATTHGDVRYKNIGVSAVGCFGLAAGLVFFVKTAHAHTKKLQWDRDMQDSNSAPIR